MCRAPPRVSCCSTAAARILLFRFDPDDRPPFWCTPGGALDPGESHEMAARRELFEETGIDADCGPELFRRLAEFTTIEGVPVIADERYFLVRTDASEIDTGGHTAARAPRHEKLALVHARGHPRS